MESEPHEFREPDYPSGDVRVYPTRFPTRRTDPDGDGHDEYVATEVRIQLGAHPSRRNRKGSYVTHKDLVTIEAVNREGETLAEIMMHKDDERRLMETLVYWFAGVGGLAALQDHMEKYPIEDDDQDDEPPAQPAD